MKSTKHFLSAAISIALALTFFCCSSDSNGGGGVCSGKSYDTTSYRCEKGELIGSCSGKDYYAEYEQCINGEIKDIVETKFSSSSVENNNSSSSLENIGISSSSSSSSINSISSSSSRASSSSISSSSAESSSSVSYGSISYGGQTYKTVVIGTRTWMAENLNYDASGSWCYENNQSNCSKYGRLYNWATAMNLPSSCNSYSCSNYVSSKHRGIYPEGWHLPSMEEWRSLAASVGGSAGKLKAKSGWNGSSGNGTDDYGFAALPSGERDINDRFRFADSTSSWWSVGEDKDNESSAYILYLRYTSDIIFISPPDKKYGFSVRCLQDDSSSSIPSSSSAIASSSSATCIGFVNGTTRLHGGMNKPQFCDERDGKKYVYVPIGEQVWMAENLNYDAPNSKCYDNSEIYCEIYGRLYNWVTVMDLEADYNTTLYGTSSCGTNCYNPASLTHRGICPDGWHLPSNKEWQELLDFAGGDGEIAVKKLKTMNGWDGDDGKDNYGFAARPGGNGNSDGSFVNVSSLGYWWSATEYRADIAYRWGIGSRFGWVYVNKSLLSSVRCLQD
jgi:uncharacterized protein (TIGR02145 family)